MLIGWLWRRWHKMLLPLDRLRLAVCKVYSSSPPVYKLNYFCQADKTVQPQERGQPVWAPQDKHTNNTRTHSYLYSQAHIDPSIYVYKTHITAICLQQGLKREQVNILTVHSFCCRPWFSVSLCLVLHHTTPPLCPVL